jgi:hypothetical protein
VAHRTIGHASLVVRSLNASGGNLVVSEDVRAQRLGAIKEGPYLLFARPRWRYDISKRE